MVSTPGKLILMGEHAVVYGRPALVAAIDLRLRASFSSPGADDAAGVASPPEVEIDLPGLGHSTAASWREVLDYARRARAGWAAYAERPDPAAFRDLRGDDPAHIVKVALGEAAEALGGTPAPRLRLRLDSELPVGAGFGSSAAAAVATVAGYAAWRAQGSRQGEHGKHGRSGRHDPPGGSDRSGPWGEIGDLDPAAMDAILRLALEAERRQHGFPSGVDTATSLHGGLLWARRPASGELTWERLAAASPLLGRLCVYHTGTPPEPTGAVVAAVRARRDRDPAAHDLLFDRMAAATRDLRSELDRAAERPAQVVALIREHEACLEALGVVPEPAQALVRQVEAAGGAAKISGAGSLAGPGAGCLLVYHPDPPAVAGWSFMHSFACLPVRLGAAGLLREAS